eukprot:192749_1
MPNKIQKIEEEIELFTQSHSRQCCCVLIPVDDEEFDFFLVSFVFYLLFMMALYMVMIMNQIMWHNSASTLTSHHDNALLDTHHLTVTHAMDYILIYGVLILVNIC